MIGIVVVSHSAKLAEGVCELAGQMAQGRVPLAAAGGVRDPSGNATHAALGTDVLAVLAAIESVYADDGVLVLMDLGGAVLSAEMALEMLPDERRARVQLCAAPLVEGTVAAVIQALAGGDLAQVAAEAGAALSAKSSQLGAPPVPFTPSLRPVPLSGAARETILTLRNPLGLHARPAAQFATLAARFGAELRVRRLDSQSAPVSARSLTGLLSLGARRGERIVLAAQGPDSADALAALSRLVEDGFGEAEHSPLAEALPTPPPISPALHGSVLVGVGAAPGIALGAVHTFRQTGPVARVRLSERFANAAPTDAEIASERLLEAIEAVRDDVARAREGVQRRLGAEQAAIFDAQRLFLEDPALIEAALQCILEQSATAEAAWRTALEGVLGRYASGVAPGDSTTDPAPDYLQARIAEFADLGQQVLRQLRWDGPQPPTPSEKAPPSGAAIWVTRDLTPAQCAQLDPRQVLGVCTELGSPNSHSAILVRALRIPMVVGLGAEIARLADGVSVALDGKRGRVWVAPDAATAAALEAERAAWIAAEEAARATASRPAVTRDGLRIQVLANIGSLADVQPALAFGAEGVGVLRTEFLYLNRTTAPTEEDQAALYAEIASGLGERPLVIRTLDVGGDKPLPYLHMEPEANPFLGWRGIRISLAQPEVFKTQLRAILRTSALAPHRVTILLPMVSDLAETRALKALLSEAKAELRRSDVPFDDAIALGVMIEVPSAVAVADQLAAEVDYLSIGTNDLCQYVLAADRTNPRVAPLADPFHPAVLRSIRHVVQAARGAGIRVGLCGEFAGDPQAVPLLLGLDVDELSMSAPAIPAVKAAIADCTLPACQALATAALARPSAEVVRDSVRAYLVSAAG